MPIPFSDCLQVCEKSILYCGRSSGANSFNGRLRENRFPAVSQQGKYILYFVLASAGKLPSSVSLVTISGIHQLVLNLLWASEFSPASVLGTRYELSLCSYYFFPITRTSEAWTTHLGGNLSGYRPLCRCISWCLWKHALTCKAKTNTNKKEVAKRTRKGKKNEKNKEGFGKANIATKFKSVQQTLTLAENVRIY